MAEGFVLNIPMDMLNRLDEADKKINKLADTSEKASKRIVDAFVQMSTQGVNAFIDGLNKAQQQLAQLGNTKIQLGLNTNTSGIQQLVSAIQQLSNASKTNITINGLSTVGNQTQTAIDAINKLMQTLQQLQQMGGQQLLGGVNSLGRQTLREMNREAKKMEKTLQKLDTAIQNYSISATDLANKLQQARQAQQSFNQLARQQAQSDVSRLLGMKGSQQTLNELKNYSNELKRTMANLDPKTKEWRELNAVYKQTNAEIKRINEQMRDVNTKHKSLINTAEQLKRAFTLMFSVSAIKGYISQIVRVRGEMELQQRSLQALLQNKDAADKIWAQTLELAVKSPFQIKELVTYTKQLAAYRVESEKLFDTTKMLADVSAGLGVDMQRLILAYGQVKAANYLRGTELRQFSEAGINMLGELATYFSEIEGRAISTGEVFERISKRMVVFSDVEEVFRRITSEGGIFYQMQEKQAETLKGQVSNLRDSIDIMLNEIGTDQDSTLKSMVNVMRVLVENWREIEWYLVRIIPLFGAWKVGVAAMSFANSGFLRTLINNGDKLITFAQRLGLSAKAADVLTNKLLGLTKLKVAGIAGLLIGIGVAIFEIWRRSTKATRELNRLNKELGKLLAEDKSNLDKQIKGFDNLVNRLQLVNKGSNEHKEIIASLNQNYGEYLGYIVNEKTTYEQLKLSIEGVTQALANKAKMASYEKAYGKILETTNEKIINSQKEISKIFKEGIYKNTENGQQIKWIPSENDIYNIFRLYEEEVRKSGEIGHSVFAKVLKQWDNLVFYNIDLYDDIETYGEAVLRQKDEELKLQERINNTYGYGTALTAEHRRELEALNKAQQEELKTAKTRRTQDEVNRKYAIERIKLEGKYQGLSSEAINKQIAELEKKSKTIIDVNKKIANSVDKLGEKYADMIYISDTQAEGKTISEIAKSSAESWKSAQETIEEQNALKKAGTVYDKKILEDAQKKAKAYEYLLKLLGREDLLVHKKDAVATKLRNQINLLKEMNKEYEKLVKIMPKEEAQAQVRKSYEPTAEALGMDISKQVFNDKGTEDAINSLFAKFPQRLHTEIKKALDGYSIQIGVEARQKSLENLKKNVEEYFARFDMSKSIEEMGISPEFAQKYFGFEYMDLDALSRAIASKTTEMKKFGEEGEKVAKQTTEKLTTIERKAQEERLKTYLQYARNSIGERAKIKLEELRKLAEIERTFTKDDQKNEKEAAQKAVKEESYQATQKLEWEEFQKTDTFINLFKDLDFASQKLINHTIQKLNEFKDQWKDMPLEDMRSIVSKINELEGALVSINPFQSAKDLKAGGAGKKGNVEALQTEAIDIEQKLAANEQEVALYEEYLRLVQEIGWEQAFNFAIEQNRRDLLNETEDSLANEITQRKTISNNLEKDLVSVNTKLIKEKQLAKSYQDQAEAISQAQKMANDLIDVFSELAEVLGADSDGIGMTFVNMGQSMMNTVLNTIMLQAQLNAAAVAAKGLGAAMNTAMGVVGWIVMAIQLLVELISAIFKAKDKSLVNQIDALAKSAEKTQEAFDELANSIDEIYSSDALAETNKEMEQLNRNLIANLKAQKSLQQERKQTDEVKEEIENLNDAILEAEQAIVDAQKDVFSHATDGILDSAMDAARGFVDAWADAYAETGNGMKGLEENFEEMLLNMAKQQAAQQIVGHFAKQWQQDLENYIGGDDMKITKEDAQAWAEEIRRTFPELNAALEGYLGVIMDNIGGGSLSGLQQEIGSMSESTAQILAAYLNSIRYFVAENNATIKQLRDYVIGEDEQVNPMLAQLRIIAQQTSSIRSLLDSVAKGGHSEGGMGLKVFIN